MRLFMQSGRPNIFLPHEESAPSGVDVYKRQQLNHLVPYKTPTKNFYTMAKGIIPINTFSGITTSDPSDNPMYKQIGIITGPSHAEEVSRGKLSYLSLIHI